MAMDGRKGFLLWLALLFTAVGCSRKEVNSPLQPSYPSGAEPVSGVPMTTARKPLWGGNKQPTIAPVEIVAEEPRKGPARPETMVAFADVQIEAALDEKTPPTNREALLDSARAGYQKALQQDPKCKGALLGLARFYSRLGDTAKSVDMYKQYLTFYPTDKDVAHEVALAHAKWKDWAGAVAWCKFTLSIDPENLAVRKTMAFCLTREGKWEQGFHMMCEVVSEPQARYLMARALEHQRQPEQARQQLLLALQADPNYADAREFLAELDAMIATPAAAAPSGLRQVEYRDRP
jgi:tetratricopeptide (TPR) repeat protein